MSNNNLSLFEITKFEQELSDLTQRYKQDINNITADMRILRQLITYFNRLKMIYHDKSDDSDTDDSDTDDNDYSDDSDY